MEPLKPHDLLRIPGPEAAHCEEPGAPLPDWALRSLRRASWTVVRRTWAPSANLIPVGVRGDTRRERLAAFVDREAVVERLAPEDVAAISRAKGSDRTPALRAVGELDELLRGYSWGPAGSVGFELASGVPSTNPESDLDVVIRAPVPWPLREAVELSESLAALPVRVDVQMDTPSGAVSLQEYARGGEVVVRTADGPRVARSPWQEDAPVTGTGGRPA